MKEEKRSHRKRWRKTKTKKKLRIARFWQITRENINRNGEKKALALAWQSEKAAAENAKNERRSVESRKPIEAASMPVMTVDGLW